MMDVKLTHDEWVELLASVGRQRVSPTHLPDGRIRCDNIHPNGALCGGEFGHHGPHKRGRKSWWDSDGLDRQDEYEEYLASGDYPGEE